MYVFLVVYSESDCYIILYAVPSFHYVQNRPLFLGAICLSCLFILNVCDSYQPRQNTCIQKHVLMQAVEIYVWTNCLF